MNITGTQTLLPFQPYVFSGIYAQSYYKSHFFVLTKMQTLLNCVSHFSVPHSLRKFQDVCHRQGMKRLEN